jgi:hypothetical protein
MVVDNECKWGHTSMVAPARPSRIDQTR